MKDFGSVYCVYCSNRGVVRGPLAFAPCPARYCTSRSKLQYMSEPIIQIDIQKDILRIQAYKSKKEQMLQEQEELNKTNSLLS